MQPRDRAARLAAKQHSVITAGQARSCGLSADQIRQQVRSGRWLPYARGVYVVAGSVNTWEQRTTAAVLAAGEAAVASHFTAAWLHRLVERRPDRIEVTVPVGTRNGRSKTARVHRARSLTRADVRRVDGIPVTGPGRTLIDIAGVLKATALGAALDRALLRKLATIPALRRYIAERQLGALRGVGTLVRLLDDREFGVPESQLEREFLDLVERFGLPDPVRQAPVGPYRVDFAYPDIRLLVEVDGRATHGTAEAFEADPVRQNDLVLEGWDVLRFTWKQVTQELEYVAATIRRALSVARA